MSDERKFATAKMNKPLDIYGKIAGSELLLSVARKKKNEFRLSSNKNNYRRILYVFLIPILFIEWLVVMIYNLLEVVTNAIKEVALSLETYIHNANPISSGSQSETDK